MFRRIAISLMGGPNFLIIIIIFFVFVYENTIPPRAARR